MQWKSFFSLARSPIPNGFSHIASVALIAFSHIFFSELKLPAGGN
jgi:hypothetical protein